MSSAIYSPEADDDLVGIADYIARDKPEAARAWIARLQKACETLAANPNLGQLREGFGVRGCRSFSVGNYVIFFREKSDGIEVARIVHGGRDMSNL